MPLFLCKKGNDETEYKKKTVTTEELFDITCKILKEKGKMSNILDYGLATHNPVPITNKISWTMGEMKESI